MWPLEKVWLSLGFVGLGLQGDNADSLMTSNHDD